MPKSYKEPSNDYAIIASGRHSSGGKSTTQHRSGTACVCGWRGNDAKCFNRHLNKCKIVKEQKKSK